MLSVVASAAGTQPAICEPRHQRSKRPCVRSQTFGCNDDGSEVWVRGCRANFTLRCPYGGFSDVLCGYRGAFAEVKCACPGVATKWDALRCFGTDLNGTCRHAGSGADWVSRLPPSLHDGSSIVFDQLGGISIVSTRESCDIKFGGRRRSDDRTGPTARCDGPLLAHNASNRFEVFNLTRRETIGSIDELTFAERAALEYRAIDVTELWSGVGGKSRGVRSGLVNGSDGTIRKPGDLPHLRQILRVPRRGSVRWRLHDKRWRTPCSSARGEDAMALRTFFVNAATGLAQQDRGATFLEIGAFTGRVESVTWVFEKCLGWRGVLAEASPNHFDHLLGNRPAALTLRVAICPTGGNGRVDFSTFSVGGTFARVLDSSKPSESRRMDAVSLECRSLGRELRELGVSRLDLAVVDTEGMEEQVLASLLAEGVSLGVVVVEVRGDGIRMRLLAALLRHGMRYVGQLSGRGSSWSNAVIDDVYANFTHLRKHFPTSRGGVAAPGLLSQPARRETALSANSAPCCQFPFQHFHSAGPCLGKNCWGSGMLGKRSLKTAGQISPALLSTQRGVEHLSGW